MEEIQILNKFKTTVFLFLLIFFSSFVLSCTSAKIMKDADRSFEDDNEEFKKLVKIESLPIDESSKKIPKPEVLIMPAKKEKKAELKAANISKSSSVKIENKSPYKQKADENFVGRRPAIDPFVAGEKVVLAVKGQVGWLSKDAGEIVLSMAPNNLVNNRVAYNFLINAYTTSAFVENFYALDFTSKIVIDYENEVPIYFASRSIEKKSIKENIEFFDHGNNSVFQWKSEIKQGDNHDFEKIKKDKKSEADWENKVREDGSTNKEEARGSYRKVSRNTWSVAPFSQNFFSVAFYLRNFDLIPGQSIKINYTDDSKNGSFEAKVLRREKLDTVLGVLDTVVITPEFPAEGKYKPKGKFYIWMTDDDRKFIVKLDVKLKYGQFLAEVRSIAHGER
ncbi:MAG: hypothetical protein A2Z20_00615 [Bdellovibrionales bacterium RBG_16_40_8]|nr:MAG: hypothetical protein A2Z20_00615 [Bdellovibrionales bacterium RBG_16_40_8]